MQIRNVVFDCDGVLVRSAHIHERTERAACLELGLDVSSIDWSSFPGLSDDQLFNELIRLCGKIGQVSADDIARRYREMFISAIDGETVESLFTPGAIEFVLEAKRRCRKIGVATSMFQAPLLRVLDVAGITWMFDTLVTFEDVGSAGAKPKPDPYLLAMRNIEADPNETLLIEDSLGSGVPSIIAAGGISCWLTDSAKEAPNGVRWKVRSFAELRNKIGW